jgi:hypothetical protein
VQGDLQKAEAAFTSWILGRYGRGPVSATAVSVLTTGEYFSSTRTPRPDSSGAGYTTAAKSQFMQRNWAKPAGDDFEAVRNGIDRGVVIGWGAEIAPRFGVAVMMAS